MTRRSPISRLRAAAILLLLVAGVAQAMTIERMQVSRDGSRYDVAAAMVVDLPLAIAFRAASDYDRLAEFNPSVVSSQRLDGNRLRSDVRMCVAFFCKNIRQVMRYREAAPKSIDMKVVPDSGDLKSGYADWRFFAVDAQRARLTLNAAIEPAFWVPPLIGPYLIARELRRQAEVTGRAIEQLGADYAHHGADHPADTQSSDASNG